MQRGAFKSFVHDHEFRLENGGTRMVDVLTFAAPLGILGLIAETLILKRYLTKLLHLRAAAIKEAAED
jgi:ligand-binding SRPBCC domain-containing protein